MARQPNRHERRVQNSPSTILVAGGISPDRTIALEILLREAAERHGWSDRLTFRIGGLGPAAGRITDAGLAALRGRGIEAAGKFCPDLERRTDLLERCDFIVCDCAEVADALVDWDQAASAQFVCLDDLAATDAEEDRPKLSLAEDVAEIEELVPEVLRRIVARAPAET